MEKEEVIAKYSVTRNANRVLYIHASKPEIKKHNFICD